MPHRRIGAVSKACQIFSPPRTRVDPVINRLKARLQSIPLVYIIILCVLGLVQNADPSSASHPAQLDPTATAFPLYLPHLSRRVGGTPTPRPTGALPPPITPEPIAGYLCRRPGDTGICWASARFTLARGPGPACGQDMTVVYFLVSDTVSLELYEGSYVHLRGLTDDSPGCPPLLRVRALETPPTPVAMMK